MVVKQWQGTGQQNTEAFTMPTPGWRVRYDCRLSAGVPSDLAVFMVFVEGTSGNKASEVVSSQTPGVGQSIIHDAGAFYLKINTANCKWQIWVERPGN